MNEIDIVSTIKRENLDERNYFKTLIEEAYFHQMLTDDDIVNLQIQILQLLDEIVYKYNGLDSSSIRKEVLKDISNSNNYTIGVYLKTFRNPDEALKEIKQNGVKKAYQEGRKKIDRMLNIIRIMYIKVKQNKLDIDNDIYNDTILEGIKGFLKIYDSDFEANNMKITADYPLYNNLIGKLDGVEFIKEYLNSIYLENSFMRLFTKERITYLLHTYSHDYKYLIINIFEIVLLEVFACKLAKRNIQDLIISNSELNNIYSILKNKTKDEIGEYIKILYEEIRMELLGNDEELQKYIEKNMEYIINLIINSLETKTLERIFIIQKFIEL